MEKEVKEAPISALPKQKEEGKGNIPPIGSNDTKEVSDSTDGNPQNEGREHTRSKMALLFVLGFFAILFLCFLYSIMVGASLNELKEVLTAVVGALSGILGFIVGYYYKSEQEK